MPSSGTRIPRRARCEGSAVERGDDLKSFLCEAAVVEQRRTQVADTDQDDRLKPRGAESLGQLAAQRLDVVTEPAGAELAEVGQSLRSCVGFTPAALASAAEETVAIWLAFRRWRLR